MSSRLGYAPTRLETLARLGRYDKPTQSPCEAFAAGIEMRDMKTCIKLLDNDAEAVTKPSSPFEWLRDLLLGGITSIEIVDVLLEEREQRPWICYDLDKRTAVTGHEGFFFCRRDYHQPQEPSQGKVHTPSKIEVKRMIAALCGLCGVIPTSNNRKIWQNHVFVLSHTRSAIASYGTIHGSPSSGWIYRAFDQCYQALDRLTNLIQWLQKYETIGDYIVILRLDTRSGVEAVRVPWSLVTTLEESVDRALNSARTQISTQPADECCSGSEVEAEISEQLINELCAASGAILCLFTKTAIESWMLRGTDTEMALDACALAVQALCVGMLSFSQAHVGEIDPFFLEHSLSRVFLYGTRGRLSTEPSISLELVDLTCAGDMIDSKVMAFSLNSAHVDEYHDLTITPRDLLDIWGPGTVTPYQHPGSPKPPPGEWSSGIAIRGGVVYKPTPDSSKMHWKSGTTAVARRNVPFENDLERPMIIGADPMINTKCPIKPDPYHNTVARTNISTFIQELGTWPERWSLREMQIGYQAGQYMNATFNATWIKSESRTRKQKGLEDVDLDFLNKPWGLLLSLCTGVAYRVAIREVVAEVMLPIMDAWMDKPMEVQALLSIGDGLLEKLKKPTFRAWVDALQNSEQHALRNYSRHVLGKICWTGVNDAADLVVSCPAFDNSDGCVHVPMKESRALACILKDTEHSATFACLTNTCFCVEPYACRKTPNPQWQNRVSVLVTSVCQYKWVGANDWKKLPRNDFEDKVTYWMGPKDGKRRVKIYSASCKSEPTSLKISDSSAHWRFNRRFWERLNKMRDETHIELRERSLMMEDYAMDVIIHDEAAMKRKKR